MTFADEAANGIQASYTPLDSVAYMLEGGAPLKIIPKAALYTTVCTSTAVKAGKCKLCWPSKSTLLALVTDTFFIFRYRQAGPKTAPSRFDRHI